ncbi:hypothetical protein C8J56DRAFT_951714 [Mycena floridula]|nr:hypothetical protein C8J56DRAFT_1027893 [Mycena floridula]KAJ7583746.1 hypothetical protein C8J56DRAFT_951714 [Mycena floridula]
MCNISVILASILAIASVSAAPTPRPNLMSRNGAPMQVSVAIAAQGSASEHWGILVHQSGKPTSGAILYHANTRAKKSAAGALGTSGTPTSSIITKPENWKFSLIGDCLPVDGYCEDAAKLLEHTVLSKAPPQENCVDFVRMGLSKLLAAKHVDKEGVDNFWKAHPKAEVDKIRTDTAKSFKDFNGGKPEAGKPAAGKPASGKPAGGKPAGGKPAKPAAKP